MTIDSIVIVGSFSVFVWFQSCILSHMLYGKNKIIQTQQKGSITTTPAKITDKNKKQIVNIAANSQLSFFAEIPIPGLKLFRNLIVLVSSWLVATLHVLIFILVVSNCIHSLCNLLNWLITNYYWWIQIVSKMNDTFDLLIKMLHRHQTRNWALNHWIQITLMELL